MFNNLSCLWWKVQIETCWLHLWFYISVQVKWFNRQNYWNHVSYESARNNEKVPLTVLMLNTQTALSPTDSNDFTISGWQNGKSLAGRQNKPRAAVKIQVMIDEAERIHMHTHHTSKPNHIMLKTMREFNTEQVCCPFRKWSDWVKQTVVDSFLCKQWRMYRVISAI